MSQGGFSRSEAERLEALMLQCEAAAEKAAATGDSELLEYTVATGQGCIDALTASFFVERRMQVLKATNN